MTHQHAQRNEAPMPRKSQDRHGPTLRRTSLLRSFLRSAYFSLCLASLVTACSGDSEIKPGATASTGSDGEHGHGDSHGHHPHPDTGTFPDTTGSGSEAEFIPELVGSAPPDPGPRDCSALSPTGIEVGDVAPSFTLLNAFGKPVRLHDYCNHVVSLISGTMSCSH